MAEVVTGLPELFRNLDRLSLVGREEVLTKMGKSGAQILEVEMRALAPVDTGQLAGGITTRVLPESSADEVIVGVGPGKAEFYGLFIEFGTAHHAPQPFMAPALEARKKDIVEKMVGVFWAAIPSSLK